MFSLFYSMIESRVKVQQKLNHEKKQQWKKEHVEKDGSGEEKEDRVQKTRGREREGQREKGTDGQRVRMTRGSAVKE